MKLRIRCQQKTFLVQLEDDPPTLDQLRLAVIDKMPDIPLEFSISLNGQAPVSTDNDSIVLSDLGIVSGDLIHVLLPSGSDYQSGPSTSRDLSSALSSSLHVTQSCSRSAVPAGSHSVAMSSSSAMDASTSEIAVSSSDETQMEVNDVAHEMEETASKDAVAFNNKNLDEPILVQDSTEDCLPLSLVETYSTANPTSSSGALVVVLHVLMTELGFQFKGNFDEFFGNGNNEKSYQLQYSHPSIDDAQFRLLFVPLQSTCMVHGIAKLAEMVHKCSLQVMTTEFVNTEFVNNHISADALSTYKGSNLPNISRIFKDKVGYPLVQFALRESGLPMLPDLPSIFEDVQLKIMKFLDVRSLLNLSEVNRHWNELAKTPMVWKSMHRKDFGHIEDISPRDAWYRVYKQEYKERKERQRKDRDWRRPHNPFANIPRRPDIPPMPHPGFAPGFAIGGDYDLFPGNFPGSFRGNYPGNFPGNFPDNVRGPIMRSTRRPDDFFHRELLSESVSVHQLLSSLQRPLENGSLGNARTTNRQRQTGPLKFNWF